jgi:hypothetical protein
MSSLFPAPPKFLNEDQEQSLTLKTGQSTAIEVPFTGNPQPQVKWTFNGGKFTDPRRIKTETIFNMTSLTLAKAQRGDAGSYQVALSNEHGQGKVTIKINVIGE